MAEGFNDNSHQSTARRRAAKKPPKKTLQNPVFIRLLQQLALRLCAPPRDFTKKVGPDGIATTWLFSIIPHRRLRHRSSGRPPWPQRGAHGYKYS